MVIASAVVPASRSSSDWKRLGQQGGRRRAGPTGGRPPPAPSPGRSRVVPRCRQGQSLHDQTVTIGIDRQLQQATQRRPPDRRASRGRNRGTRSSSDHGPGPRPTGAPPPRPTASAAPAPPRASPQRTVAITCSASACLTAFRRPSRRPSMTSSVTSGASAARCAAVTPPHRDAAGRGERPALGDQRQIQAAAVRDPAQIGQRGPQFGPRYSGDRLDLGEAARQRLTGSSCALDRWPARRPRTASAQSNRAADRRSPAAAGAPANSSLAGPGRPGDAARCRPPRPAPPNAPPRCRRGSPVVRTAAYSSAETPSGPSDGNAHDAVQSFDVDGFQVVRGDQRRLVVVGKPDRFVRTRSTRPPRPAPGRMRERAVGIRTDAAVHRHREAAAGVPDGGRRDVHPGDDPGTRNEGADDGLFILVQPDGGYSSGDTCTLTGRGREGNPGRSNRNRHAAG